MTGEVNDPFEETDNASVRVDPGTFTDDGPVQERTGATNARAARGTGVVAAWGAASREKKVNVIAAIAAALVLIIVLPTVISLVGVGRREALVAQAVEDAQINFVYISDEMRAAEASANVVLGAYAVSSGFAPDEQSEQQRSRLNEVSDSVLEGDAGRTQELSNDAREYFVADYVPALVDNVEVLRAEWPQVGYETDVAVADSLEDVIRNLDESRIDQLAAAVIDLANNLGLAREEHYSNQSSYVPPAPAPSRPDSGGSAPEPEEEEEPTEEPAETQEPEQPEEPAEPTPEEPEKPEKPEKPEIPDLEPEPSMGPG